jgi:hypothetical protein
MANSISGVDALQQLTPVAATTPTQKAKQTTKYQAVAPQDTVHIHAARVASQAQAARQQQVSGVKDHDGDSK